MSLNHITLLGRLTKNPELRSTQSGINVAHFTVAVDRDYSGRDDSEKQTDFIDCVAWRKTGEFISKYFNKGKPILVYGALHMRKWQDRNGNNRISYEVIVESAYFAGGDKTTNSAASEPALVDIDDSDGELPWADDDLPL